MGGGGAGNDAVTAFYNDNDPFVAQWLRNLVSAGHLPSGVVDERGIEHIRPEDLDGFDECHFFAGIGGWPLAVRQAGGTRGLRVWTGSCPCQPFSAAGRKNGFDDDRHMWPSWFRLIDACRPDVVFGEQVSSPHALEWLDAVFDDMEGAGYTCGALDLCAASVGAPHIRQRLYWVAYADGKRFEELCVLPRWGEVQESETARPSEAVLFWNDAEWIECIDEKQRPVEPGTFPLVDGFPTRVEQLRAYGNAIVVPLAAKFVSAFFGERNA